MKNNFVKIEKKNRHYSPEQIEKIKRGNKHNKVKRGRKPTEY